MTVRFETAETPPGPVRSFSADDPALSKVTIGLQEEDDEPESDQNRPSE